MAWIGFVEHDQDRSIKVIASCGDKHGYLKGIDVGWGSDPEGSGPTGAAVRTNRVQINRDFFASEHMKPWRDRAAKSGFQSSIAIPLSVDDKVLGVLSAYAEEPDAFDELEVRLLGDISKDVSRRLGQFQESKQESELLQLGEPSPYSK